MTTQTCINVNCNSAIDALEKRKNDQKRNTPRRKQKKKSSFGRKHVEIPSGDIPPDIGGDGGTTLMRYYNYSTAKTWKGDEETRRDALWNLIRAELRPTSDVNRTYISSFKEKNTEERVDRIIRALEKQVGGLWFVEHEEHSRWPSKQKLISDISWLKKIKENNFR
tara:strand:+ start:158 stop:655 length:498 start_codon:yes stop_codon:yes gene_type:complete